MELDAILVFVKVVQAGSFTKAAKTLKMPNTTVSAKVAALEKKLGITLIHRTTRRLSVTQPGEIYFRKCALALESIATAENEITASQDEPQGTLRITAPVDLGRALLPELVQEYLKKHPKVSIDLIVTNHIVDLVGEGIDIGIRAGDLEDSTLIARKWIASHLECYASPAYLKGRSVPEHPRDLLSKHELLLFSHQQEMHLEAKDKHIGTKIKLKTQCRFAADDLETLKALALLGQGIAFLPAFLCKQEVLSRKLVNLLPEWKMGSDHFSLVYPSQKFVSPKIQSFFKLAQEWAIAKQI